MKDNIFDTRLTLDRNFVCNLLILEEKKKDLTASNSLSHRKFSIKVIFNFSRSLIIISISLLHSTGLIPVVLTKIKLDILQVTTQMEGLKKTGEV